MSDLIKRLRFAAKHNIDGLIQIADTDATEVADELERQAKKIEELNRELAQYRNVPTHPVTLRDREIAKLKELLPVIHRDGGHYCDEHGTHKAVEDAIQIVCNLRAVADEMAEALESMMRDTGLVVLMRPDQVRRNEQALAHWKELEK